MTLKKPLPVAILLASLLNSAAQPVISTQPHPQEVPPGGTTTFQIEATGNSPLAYQWFLNSPANPIPGATNEFLVVSNIRQADAGFYRVLVSNTNGSTWSTSAPLSLYFAGVPFFAPITLPPAVELNGAGSNVDSIAFWEAPVPTNTLMFVTAKGNDLLELYRYPFVESELPPVMFPANINGVAVDQETDILYITDRIVSVLSLPDLQLQTEFGHGIIGVGENNLDLLKQPDGQTIIYVSEDHNVHRFNAATLQHLGSFAPPVTSIETVLADDFYQLILVPEEQGVEGNTGVFVYHPDGTPYEQGGTNRFGSSGIFDSDEEGILLYTFPSRGIGDDGTGLYVVADQKSDLTDFEFFDRQTWTHLGALRLEGVSNTDGIASTQLPLPGYPMGLFAAINDDRTTVLLGWDVILEAIGLDRSPRAVTIDPRTTLQGGSIEFTVTFSQPVTRFDEVADLEIRHQSTSHTNIAITGSGKSYNVTISGISGSGYFTLAVSSASDVEDLAAQPLASSVTSVPVFNPTPYQAWAEESGLIEGINAGPDDDPDGDDCLNIREFATNSDPLNAAPDAKQRASIEEIGGVNRFTYTFPVRDGAGFGGSGAKSAAVDGVVYTVDGSLDLDRFDEGIEEVTPALSSGLPATQPGWSYRTFSLATPTTMASTGFIRLRVESTP